MIHPLPYELTPDTPAGAPMGLIVLSVDETLESEINAELSGMGCPVYVTRIRSGTDVSLETLAAMESELAGAADLLPKARPYGVIGYGCTSASAIIGSGQIESIIQSVCDTDMVTNPLRAAIAQAHAAQVHRFALLSPYIEPVNAPLRTAFAKAGLSTEVFGTFAEPTEANVARICPRSIVDAATRLGESAQVDAVFISCTNLRTRAILPEIRARIGKPVFSSNQSLAWHMHRVHNSMK